MPDYFAIVKEKEEEEDDLYKRMDSDADLLHLEQYKLTDPKGHEVPDIVNVTLNKPAVFAANVVSSLGSVVEQVSVESSNLGKDVERVEDFITTAFEAANRRLLSRGEAALNMFADAQLCFRGRTARRVLFRKEEGEIICDIQPWDGRYLRYQMGPNGLVWAAYRTMRKKGDVLAEYPNSNPKGKMPSVLDVWDSTGNYVWVDDQKVVEQPHDYGAPPVVLSVVPLGYGNILMDEKRIKREGESIFFLVRDIVPQLNMLMSILQTLNLKLVKAPQQYASKEGAHAEPPEYEDATGSGAMTSVDIGGGITPVDYGDAKNAAQMAYNMMERAFQEGGYTDIDLGNPRQPFSAVAMITAGESKDMVFLPRLAAKESLNLQTADMFIKQVQKIGGTVKILNREFDQSILRDEYRVKFQYYVKNPKTDIAKMAVAQIAERYYPPRYLLSDVLQVEDVEGVLDEKNSHDAELISPNIKRHRIIMSLLKKAENGDENSAIEAEMLAAEQGVSLDQLKQGILPQQVDTKKPGPEAQLPLLGANGQQGEMPPEPGLSIPMLKEGVTPGGAQNV